MFSDTICAISTAPGCGGIAVVRVSGPQAVALCNRHLDIPLNPQVSHKACLRRFRLADGSDLDEVVCTLFRAPHSYTGEDTVEISCHGSVYIQNRLVQELTDGGCRLARAGEFTQRAFLNGKMDLSQAEAVADLIAADSSQASRLALKQLRGGISDDLKQLREQLLHLSSLLELELDFGEEDVAFADRQELQQLALRIEERLAALTDSFHTGNAIKNGIPVAIVGQTNAGKSTLLNRLLRDEKAIVSDVHGTTRDSIEDTVFLEGVKFRFIDTAGLRDTTDTVERLGIERTLRKMDEAAIVLWVIDAPALLETSQEEFNALSCQVLSGAEGKKCLLLLNKCDLLSDAQVRQTETRLKDFLGASHSSDLEPYHPEAARSAEPKAVCEWDYLLLSARFQQHTDELEHRLVQWSGLSGSYTEGDTIVTNLRHYEALSAALQATRRVRQALAEGLSGDLVSIDLHDVLAHLGAITGAISTDEILGEIFARFCIGK